MSVLVWIVIGILALKVIWNFGVPYALMRKPIDPKTGKRGGISLALGVEVILLVLAVGLAWLSKGDALINRPLAVLCFGGGAILLSYLHFFVGGVIANWLLTRKGRPPTPDSPSSTPRG
jgi:apolipoprotein N-acyltransferase